MSGKDFNSGYVICPKCGMMAAPDAPKCPNGHRLKSGRGEVSIPKWFPRLAAVLAILLLVFGAYKVLPGILSDPGKVIEIPDPVLREAIQNCLGISEREITRADAERLVYLRDNNAEDAKDSEKITDLTGLSYFTELRYIDLNYHNSSDLSAL